MLDVDTTISREPHLARNQKLSATVAYCTVVACSTGNVSWTRRGEYHEGTLTYAKSCYHTLLVINTTICSILVGCRVTSAQVCSIRAGMGVRRSFQMACHQQFRAVSGTCCDELVLPYADLSSHTTQLAQLLFLVLAIGQLCRQHELRR